MKRSFLAFFVLLFLSGPAAVQAQLTFTTNNGAITITGYTGSPTVVTIPNTTNGYPITSLAEDAFLGKDTMTSITIGTNVASVGYAAFSYCDNLTTVIFPDSVTNIGEYTFEPCTSLTSIRLPAHIGIIPEEMFGDCSSLASITIPASVTNIHEAAFDNCSGLTALYFQGNAPGYGSEAFYGVNVAVAKVYYLPGTTGWGATYDGLTTVLLNPISGIGVQNNAFGFTVTGASNQVVVVQATTNLANPDWIPLATNTITAGSFYFSDPQWANYPARFFRLSFP
jgi:hypothetical protein